MNNLPYDKIHIRELRVHCIVGIFPEEREKKQEIELNITLYTNLSDAGKSDAITDTVDYKEIKLRVLEMVEGSSFYLIERLAQAVADLCLEAPRVEAVTITLDKPGALRFARSVAVEITRRKHNGR